MKSTILAILLLLYSSFANTPVILCCPLKWAIPAFSPKEIKCLADNIYHEARGEGIVGMFAVGNVVANRYKSGKYQKNICKIVYQTHQFTWTSKTKKIGDKESHAVASHVAKLVLTTDWYNDVTNGSLFFSSGKKPGWSKDYPIKVVINGHIFF